MSGMAVRCAVRFRIAPNCVIIARDLSRRNYSPSGATLDVRTGRGGSSWEEWA